MSAVFRWTGLTALVLFGLACVVTPEPIPGKADAGWWPSLDAYDGIPDASAQGDLLAQPDASIGLDVAPPGGDPPPEGGPAPLDAAGDLIIEGGPLEGGPGEGGPGEGGPQEAGPPDQGQTG